MKQSARPLHDSFEDPVQWMDFDDVFMHPTYSKDFQKEDDILANEHSAKWRKATNYYPLPI